MDPADGERKIKKKESRLQKFPFDETEYCSVSERVKYLQEQARARCEERSVKSAANKVVGTERVSALREQVRENIELHVFRILRATGREELLSEEERQLCVDLTQRLRETTHWRNPFIYIDYEQNLPPSAIEGADFDNLRAPSSHLQQPRNIEPLRDLLIRLGAEFEDEFEGTLCRIDKSDCVWEADIKSGVVHIVSKEHTERRASVCIQWASWTRFKGYSNLGFSPVDLLVLAKVVAILFDQLPESIAAQTKYFLETGRTKSLVDGENHVTPLTYLTNPSAPLTGLRNEMLLELNRLRDLLTDDTPAEPPPPPPEGSSPPPSFGSLHASLHYELAQAFRRIRASLNENGDTNSNDTPTTSPDTLLARHALHTEINQVFGRTTPPPRVSNRSPRVRNSRSFEENRHALERLQSGSSRSSQNTSSYIPPPPSNSPVSPPPPPPQSEEEAERQVLRMLLAQLQARL
ncbi:MAG: hypothetical protein ACFFDI_21965 [Promethearchaeota archaeon]